jgi:hypothetical protein
MKIPTPSRIVAVTVLSSLTAASCANAADPPKLTNAAQARFGARFSLTTTKDGSRDPQTSPDSTFDGNTRTRCVLRGATPYTFTIELPESLPIEKLTFSQSEYATERAPRDIEIGLEDGTVLKHTLELLRPAPRKPAWQDVPVGGKSSRVIKVTVLSNYEPGGEKVNWGGLSEISVFTPTDLETRFRVTGTEGPVFVHQPPMAAGAAVPKVKMPPTAKPGEHPRLLLTPGEISSLKATLTGTERGKATWKSFETLAATALKTPINFPDPAGPPAQVKERGDEVAQRHSDLSERAGTLGMAYTLTGDKQYATRAAEIVKGYADRYAAYPEHKGANKADTGKIMAQRLSEAMWLIPLIEAYDHIYSSGVLTDADRKHIETDLLRSCVAFIRRKDPDTEAAERDARNPGWRTGAPAKGHAANWLLFYNTATMMTGAVTENQNLKDLAATDFRFLLANGIGTDGMWDEGAIGYQFFAMSALIGGVETAARNGIDLWSFDDNRFKRLFDSPLRYAYPDGSAPGINDSGRARLGNWSTMSYDYAYQRYGDPGYAFLVNASPRQLHMSQAVYFPTRVYDSLPEVAATTYPSTVFENLGYSILRAPRLYALMDYGPHGGVHGHFDKLNLILYAAPNAETKGDEMGGEPQFHRYEDPLHAQWTVQTVAHNSLAVDQKSQVASDGKLLVFEDTPTFRVMRAETTAAAPGALLDRTVVVTPDAILDIYHGSSASKHTWDRTLRFQGTLAGVPATDGKPLGTDDGYQHLFATTPLPAAQGWTGTWQNNTGEFQATVAGAPNQSVLLARGPDKDQIALIRQEGDKADFAVAYNLKSWGNPVRSLKWLSTGDVKVTAAELTHQDGTVTTVLTSYGNAPWKALGWSSDARVLCLRRQGNDLKVLLTGGTFAEGKDGSLNKTAPGNYSAERRNGQLTITSEWAPTKGVNTAGK